MNRPQQPHTISQARLEGQSKKTILKALDATPTPLYSGRVVQLGRLPERAV